MSAPLLDVRGLRTTFPTDEGVVRAVDGARFDVSRGETVCLVGESGSGKSVTARSILGIVDDHGRVDPASSIRFDGTELVGASETTWQMVRGDLALVFQNPGGSMNPVYTVGNQLRETIRINRDLDGDDIRKEAVRLINDVGISDPARRLREYPHEFSGGMKQRAALALALACDPDLLVLDEPTTALDVTTQAQILALLDDLQAEYGLGVLLITHDMGVVEEVADRVNVMYAGRIVESAPADRLFDNPRHPYTRGLLASIPGRAVDTERLRTIEGEVPTITTEPTGCRFADRCPDANEECESAIPDAQSVTTDHRAACLYAMEDNE